MMAPKATASPLLSLPPELRNRVFDFYFSFDPLTAPPPVSRSYLTLTISCRQLYHETRTLAFAATTFRTTLWQLSDLRRKLQAVRPELRPLIKRLEISVGINDFIVQRCSLDGIEFARAGLSGLEELFISFTKEPTSDCRPTYVLSNLEVLLWKTVVTCGNNRLKKIRIVHNDHFQHSIRPLEADIRKRFSLGPHHKWHTLPAFENGQFSLVRKPDAAENGAEILILFGSTINEAEEYQQVHKEKLEVSLC
ncbi:hypothetical protein P154DRAFT_616790 [Amniculicola lignicola CBS 123094]|uniref:Uncharacterized protein n=1 Tax=Amniculicola lignicola CBS 123094 TaxID=1392246 RepID=A0A6A5WSQ8_9PLEO|nr:hypothetical protein P154DRAFT_616790 [Amniculicola lignicola CBS 123094]